jgi:glycosyltransferase involved in cell wall biosynthesis
MKRRVVILTDIIAPYRIPVFNALALREELDLRVIFLCETDERLRQWRVYSDEIRFPYQVLRSRWFRGGKKKILIHRGLARALEAANPDAVICGGYNYLAFWQALWWSRRRAVEFVLWSESNGRDARAGRPLVEALKSYFLKRCDRFVVPGKASFDYLHALGVHETKIVNAPNAVDNRFFAAEAEKIRVNASEIRRKLTLPRRFILFVGRLIPEKGVFDLLGAYAKLENGLRSEIALVFAGDGISKRELKLRAEQISPGNITFTGFLHREDLPAHYALAEVLVLPTHSDPWGLVVNEAMACGLPIIVTNVAGCSDDLVKDGWNGYVIPVQDLDKLSHALEAVVRCPERRREMSANSFERIQNFSPEMCAAGLAAAGMPLPELR